MSKKALGCVIIDDSLFIRETISRLITEAGHHVIGTFHNGEKFLKHLGTIHPDVVFIDIILPNITGLELLEIIMHRSSKEKIIMLSGVAQGDAVSAALRLGAIDFIQKPVSKERLVGILTKLSDTLEIPSVEELSTIGVGCMILSAFFEEIVAHASTTVQDVIKLQTTSILRDIQKNSPSMLDIDLDAHIIAPSTELWGKYTEEETFATLTKIPQELEYELQFLYEEEFVKNLIYRSIVTMASKNRIARLFELVPPDLIGLPEIPIFDDPALIFVSKAGTTYTALDAAMSIAVLHVTDMGPEVLLKLNQNLLTDEEYMRNSIFFYTLVGQGDSFQEGLFGPLPVTSENPDLSSLIYSCEIERKLILICIYYSPVAEGIVSDYTRISFLIKTRLAAVSVIDDISGSMLRRILDDIIQYLLEN
ncbi:MAG: response regulator transcription factor [Candidatus Kariarchaeaceae archaeon]|jgi:two-component system chemotaxis response regulator CheY